MLNKLHLKLSNPNIINYRKYIFTHIKKFINRYIGKIEYTITIVSTDGNVKHYNLSTIKEVDNFVIKINNEKYWNVQKIEKFRRYEFRYKKEIIYSPLFFCLKDVTESKYINNGNYSFLKKHESLNNIKYVSSKD